MGTVDVFRSSMKGSAIPPTWSTSETGERWCWT